MHTHELFFLEEMILSPTGWDYNSCPTAALWEPSVVIFMDSEMVNGHVGVIGMAYCIINKWSDIFLN